MSDETAQPEDILSIFVDFAAEKNISSTCPTCGSDEGWNIFLNQGHHHVVPAGINQDILIGPTGINVVAMRCRNCAFVRMFHLDMIKGWRKKRDEAESKDEKE